MHILAAVLLLAAPYRAQAAQICTRSGAAEAAVASRLAVHPTRAQALSAWPRLVSLGRTEVRRLLALRPPPAVRAAHTAAVRARREQLDLLATALGRVRAGETPRAASLGMKPRVTRLWAVEQAAWRRAGVQACALWG